MKQFNGYEAKESAGEKLPAGGYVCKVVDVEIEEYTDKNKGTKFEKLKIVFDIDEGPYAYYFAQQLKANNNSDAKYKGNYRVNIPDESSEYFAGYKRTFNNLMWAFEESNSGYHWNWDEKSLIGKLFGLIFQNKEWKLENGKTGWTAQPYVATSVDKIRKEDFKVPADKPLKADGGTAGTETFAPVPDEELPF